MTSEDYRPDREINIRVLFRLAIGLLVLVALSFVGMWRLAVFLHDQELATDPPPPALPEARKPHLPPSPRLQANPIEEFEVYFSTADRHLHSYGWTDQGRGMVHVPIERAMERMIENGVPESLGIQVPEVVEAEE